MTIAITGARIWDGLAPGYAAPGSVLRIEDGRVAALGRGGSLTDAAKVLDLRGAAVVPGLIDAHVHLHADPSLTPEKARALPLSHFVEAIPGRAEAMVRAGITTARDLGGASYREVALRDEIARGDAPGPRLLCAGQPLTRPLGHCWPWGGVARSPEEVEAVVRRQLDRGVDWIKVMASGGILTPESDERSSQFDEREIRLVVEQARAAGLSTAAHCHTPRSIVDAARAGVRTIEHCSFLGGGGLGSDFHPAVVDEVARSGAFVAPTANSGWWLGTFPHPALHSFGRRMARCLRALRAAGVPMIASTDAGIPGVRHDDLPRSLPIFATLTGLTPLEALRSATSEAARALNLEHETGALRPGLSADLLAVRGDPLRNLRALRRPHLVMCMGRIYEPGR